MATPRFNRIASNFMAKINDVTTESAGIIQGGTIVTSTVRIETYVNRALYKAVNQLWLSVKGDKNAMMNLCPDLVKTASLTKSTGDMSVPGDFFELVSARMPVLNGSTVNRYIGVLPRDKYHVTQTSFNTLYVASSSSPLIYEIDGTLFLFPEITSATIEILYIQMPLKSDGSALTSGGDTDSPFTDQWNEFIADIAYELYQAELQN